MESRPVSGMADWDAGAESGGVRRMFAGLVRERRSCRKYDPDREVPRELLLECLEAARRAPSACNKQPWRFIVVTDPGRRREICEKGLLPGIRHEWVLEAPVLVVVAAVPEIVTHRLAPMISGVPYWLIDIGIAGEHFVLAATAAGLGTCWIGWFREKAVKRILGLGAGVRVASLMTLGYPSEETGPERPRRPLSEIAFENEWGRPFAGGGDAVPGAD